MARFINIFKEKIDSGEYLISWEGYSPHYLGSFYGSTCAFGDEEKFSFCHDFYSGIGDLEWWIKEELDKLTEKEKAELRSMLKRNKEVSDFIRRNYDRIESISKELNLEGPYIIHRLNNYKIKELLESENIFKTWTEIKVI